MLTELCEQISQLTLDWREAEQLLHQLQAFKYNNPGQLGLQRPGFTQLFEAIETACKNAVTYK